MLLGPRFRITRSRGELQHRDGLPCVIATYHPSFALRAKSQPDGEQVHRDFVRDLMAAASHLQDKSDP